MIKFILPLLLFAFSASAQDTTKYMPMSAKGYKFNGATFKNIWIGQDTTNYKTGIARIGSRFFVGNGVYWKEIAGGSSAPSGLTGAVVTQIDSTRFNVSPGSYYIQGSLYANGDTTFNLAQPGDTSRIDVIGLDTLGQVFTITGVESENPYPSSINPLSQIYLSFVWVDTDTVYFAPTPVNYWSALGNDIIPNNPGKVQFKNGLYVDQITANDSRLFTGKQLILQSNRPTGSKIFAGISGGNVALNTTELQLSLGDNSTTGTAKTALSLTGRSLHVSGTEAMNMISITPSIVQSGSYSGSVRGIYYNPTVTSNVGTHYAFESTAGRIKFGGTPSVNDTTSKPVVMDGSGNLSRLNYWPGGGSGGSVGTLQQVLTAGSTLTTDNTIDVDGNQLNIDDVVKFNVKSRLAGSTYSEMQVAQGEFFAKSENATIGTILNLRSGVGYLANSFGLTDTLKFKFSNPPIKNTVDYFYGSVNDTLVKTQAVTISQLTDSLQVLRDSLNAYRAQDTVHTESGIQTVYSGDSTKIRLPYKSYVALLSQSGTDAPTAIVLQNDFDGNIIWARSSTGNYTATLSGAFTENKSWCVVNNTNDAADAGYFSLRRVNSDSFIMSTFDISVTNVDDLLINTSVEIRVYY